MNDNTSTPPDNPASLFATPASRSGLRKALGPGILMAGAAIGGSHLVASTQAGAKYGFALLLVLVLVNLFKYPFFLFCQRYTAATGETVLHGFRRMGRGYVLAYFLLNLVNAFLNIAGVAMVTASLSMNLGAKGFGLGLPAVTTLVTAVCAAIIIWGRYRVLDGVTKLIIVLLTVSTVVAVVAAAGNPPAQLAGFVGESPWNLASLGFIVLFMGWMPAPIDVAVWPSLWMGARERETGHRASMREAMFDFHLGYIGTVVLAVFFLLLGALVIHGTGREFSMASAAFATRLVELYTESIGGWAYWVIAIAAFTTMFSTTLTCVDGYPRSLATCWVLLRGAESPARLRRLHVTWILLSVLATFVIATLYLQSLARMLQVAMVISFLTSPVFAWIHYRVIRAEWVPAEYCPGRALRALSAVGILFFTGFTALFLWWFFGYGG